MMMTNKQWQWHGGGQQIASSEANAR